jgi:hypothetical protein
VFEPRADWLLGLVFSATALYFALIIALPCLLAAAWFALVAWRFAIHYLAAKATPVITVTLQSKIDV